MVELVAVHVVLRQHRQSRLPLIKQRVRVEAQRQWHRSGKVEGDSVVMRAGLRGANVNEHVLQADLVAGDLVHVSLLVDEEKKNVVRLLWMMRSNTGGTTKKAKHSW